MSEVEVLLLWLAHKKFTASVTEETLGKFLPEIRKQIVSTQLKWREMGIAHLNGIPKNGNVPGRVWSREEELKAERVLYSHRPYSESYLRKAETVCRGRKYHSWIHLDLDKVFPLLFGDSLQYKGLTRQQLADVLKVEKIVADRYAKWLISQGWTEKVRRVNGTISRVLVYENV